MCFYYESESGERVDDPSEDDLDLALSHLDGAGNSFASLTGIDGSYVQVGGVPVDFTVELRRILHGGAFRHFKAALPGAHLKDNAELRIGGARVNVCADQILGGSAVREVFHWFLHGCDSDVRLRWDDITAMFDQAE